MTIKLYHSDAYITKFEGIVQEVRPHTNGHYAILLDQTAFYPESGGQPSDHGHINTIPVCDVIEVAGDILHILPEPPSTATIAGSIDWERRFDHMQQHSGQHILSAAAFEAAGAETVGFHLGSTSSQIDLTLDEFNRNLAIKIENIANQAIFSNLPVRSHYVTAETISDHPVRKQPPAGIEQIRLIDIPRFDCCPCGGTHVARTGEVGLIKILSWEKKKGLIRLEFVCGLRALSHYQTSVYILNELSARFSSPAAELLSAVEKHFIKSEQTEKELQQARTELAKHLISKLRKQAPKTPGGIQVISYLLPEASPQEVTELAKGLAAGQEPTIALIGGIHPDGLKGHIVFACSAGIPLHMGEYLKEILPLIQGKGGGSAQSAQGGGSGVTHFSAALNTSRENVLTALNGAISPE